jgi:hypothetical protein
MININYQKRKNSDVFECLEDPNLLSLSNLLSSWFIFNFLLLILIYSIIFKILQVYIQCRVFNLNPFTKLFIIHLCFKNLKKFVVQ